MPNGMRGDHPLTDIVFHKADVYSPRASTLVREIRSLADEKSWRELGDLLVSEFSPYGNPNVVLLEQQLTELRDRLRADAQTRGFEISADRS